MESVTSTRAKLSALAVSESAFFDYSKIDRQHVQNAYFAIARLHGRRFRSRAVYDSAINSPRPEYPRGSPIGLRVTRVA